MQKLEKLLDTLNHDLKIGESTEITIDLDKDHIGYLVYYGFVINYFIMIDNNVYTVKLTKKEDLKGLHKKSYSWLIKLPRTGKDGKRIYVYKLRTMQPYSEYIQDFVIEKNGLNDDGTIKDDFRITKFGKFARKYWLDELPMLFNFFNGDLKLIGVRPLSDSMLNQYPLEHKAIRHQSKPGLIPPYYIDKPKTFDEIIVSERRYLDRYKKSPILTDISYFGKFLKVVFFKGVRSS